MKHIEGIKKIGSRLIKLGGIRVSDFTNLLTNRKKNDAVKQQQQENNGLENQVDINESMMKADLQPDLLTPADAMGLQDSIGNAALGQILGNGTEDISDTSGPASENKTGLPNSLKTGLENLQGMDLSDVQVHQNNKAPAQLNAMAYTQGTDIHVAPGQDKHLPHEAWHVVQQMQGRVKPTTELNGMAVNDNVGLENEADLMGNRAARGKNK